MKKFNILIISLICFTTTLFGETKNTPEHSLKHVLSTAKEQNKTVLLYLSPFGENLAMDSLKSNKAANEWFNERYIYLPISSKNESFDEIQLQLGLGTYPGYYFLTHEGRLIYFDTGKKDTDEFTEMCGQVQSPRKYSNQNYEQDINKYQNKSLLRRTLDIKGEDLFFVQSTNKTGKLQKKWYTSVALGFYVGEKFDAKIVDEQMEITFLGHSAEELNNMLSVALKLAPHKAYIYYLKGVIEFSRGNTSSAKQYIAYFHSEIKADEIPENVKQNVRFISEY